MKLSREKKQNLEMSRSSDKSGEGCFPGVGICRDLRANICWSVTSAFIFLMSETYAIHLHNYIVIMNASNIHDRM